MNDTLGALEAEVLGPDVGGAAVVQRDALTGEQRRELLDEDPEQLAERARVAAGADVVVHVDDAGEVGDDEVPAAAHVAVEHRRGVVVDEVERGDDDQVVSLERGARGHDVDGDAEVPQRAVERPGAVGVGDVDRGVAVELHAHHACQSHTIATDASTRLPATSPSRSRTPPSSTTSRQSRVSVPAWGISPEWNFSAPAIDARTWKTLKPSAPCATCCRRHAAAGPVASRGCAAAS